MTTISASDDWATVSTKTGKRNTKVDNTKGLEKFSNITKSNNITTGLEKFSNISISKSNVVEPQIHPPTGMTSLPCTSSKPNASGIIVKIDKASKEKIRALLPNTGMPKSAATVFDLIKQLHPKNKNPDSCKNELEYKRHIIMILYQALKQDLGDLFELILNKWKKEFKYPMIEIMDSECDGCSLITQAAWSGSLIGLRLIVANGGDVHHINKKGESVLDTIRLGKNFELDKAKRGKIFIESRFNECSTYINQMIVSIIDTNEIIDTKEIIIPSIELNNTDVPVINIIIPSVESDDSNLTK